MIKRVVIIDYGTGNIYSIKSALKYLGVDSVLSADSRIIRNAKHLILPGVGSFQLAMGKLKKIGLDTIIHEVATKNGVPVLGICLGMQLMGLTSTEDKLTEGLGLIQFPVTKFSVNINYYKIPHVGFNTVQVQPKSILYRGLGNAADFYFNHSFRMTSLEKKSVTGICNHGENFIASFEKDNLFGTQFHPENSQSNGLLVLKNFLEFKNNA